jgi:hypothetical protein
MEDFTKRREEKSSMLHHVKNEEKISTADDKNVEEKVDTTYKKALLLVKEGETSKEDAINPSHYQVYGIPEAIDIMQHLLTKEQLEGFLWGNIIKYAYRYGRKGDKQETAGKIAWYANKLKEVEK